MLNPNQELAVRTVKGRVLVLAGAGSGKTRVITHRIAHLIRDIKEPPQAILGLTFTNKAAAEMRQRLQQLIGAQETKCVTLCTFHSFCMQVLRKEIEHLGYTREFSLYDEKDMQRTIKQLAREMLGHDGELPSLSATLAALAEASQQGSIENDKKTWHDQFSEDLYKRLQSTLRAYNAVSFDSLITLTIQLFEEHPNVLDRYRERFRYLMIDEYQDTNPAQFRLAELLAGKYHNLCVVGDDDQSIYGWRGAEVEHILHFKADHIIKLEQNYRSSPTILQAANAVIGRNQQRHQKKLWTAESTDRPIEIFHTDTEAEEAASVIDRIIRYRQEHQVKWSQMAILYRSNALSRHFELALMQAAWKKGDQWIRGIPYEVFGGLEFTERSEIKDLLAYLRTIANSQDQEALLRIINVPRRGISDTTLDELTQENRSLQISLWSLLENIAAGQKEFHPRATQAIRAFVDLIHTAKKRFEEGPLSEALIWLLEKIEYKKAIQDDVKSEKMRQFKWENVEECVNALAHYEKEMTEQGTTEDITLQHFIANTMLARKTMEPSEKKRNEDKVQLMTLHSAKGLEFPYVFLVGLEDHILPHEKSSMETGIEEERRLFYVGITRAQKHLTLSMSRSRLRMGKLQPTNPSRFLFEIPKELLQPTTAKGLI
ncbi:MAG: UvrD-helicase domain-containing protein [Chlamydiales bacterium]|nr:UvrD-helicase domain-containing protein [Chlamydiales bacterium]